MELLSTLTKTEFIVVLFLSLLFLITIIVQWDNPLTKFLRSKDTVNILPAWYFFAPHPVTYNIYLMYRTEYVNKQLSNWQQVKFIVDRKWYHFIWNPQKRYNKAFFDLYKGLLEDIEVLKEADQIHLSVSYLMLLNYVSSLNHSLINTRVQFSIITKLVEEEKSEVLFISGFHKIKGNESLSTSNLLFNF